MHQVQPKREEQLDHDKDNPAPSKVTAPNIRAIFLLCKNAACECRLQGRIADPLSSFSGS